MGDTHHIKQVRDHFIVVDDNNNFVCSSYTYEEALQDLTDLLVQNTRQNINKECVSV